MHLHDYSSAWKELLGTRYELYILLLITKSILVKCLICLIEQGLKYGVITAHLGSDKPRLGSDKR